MTAAKPSYDNDNVFAKILRGELPCHKVYEDEHTFVFMDIMPRADGHALVIPKAPSRNLLEIDLADLTPVMASVQKIARAMIRAFAADGITIQQFNENAGGQVVFHTHFHVIPRHEGIKMGPPGQAMADQDKLAEQAKAIRDALES